MEALSDPIVGPDVDCTDLDGFMLNVERLMASELVALSSHEVIGAAVLLWCRAWKQRPAASLPNDDKVIAAFARLPLARFRKLRDEVLRGFVLCSDGRLYHSTLAREAANAYERKLVFQRKREADAERLRKWRSATRSETPNETPVETRFVAEGQGQGQGQGQGIERESAPASRGSRLPPDWSPDDDALAYAASKGLSNGRAASEAEKFRDYWVAQAGQRGRKADWDATWRTWVQRAVEQSPSQRQTVDVEPDWRREQRERNEAFAGPFAAKRSRPEIIDVEATDAAARLVG